MQIHVGIKKLHNHYISQNINLCSPLLKIVIFNYLKEGPVEISELELY